MRLFYKHGCNVYNFYYLYVKEVFSKKYYILHISSNSDITIIDYELFCLNNKNNSLHEKLKEYKYMIYKPKSDKQIFIKNYTSEYHMYEGNTSYFIGGSDFIYEYYTDYPYTCQNVYMANDRFDEAKETKEIMDIFTGWAKNVKKLNTVQTHLILARRKNPDIQKSMRFMIQFVYDYLPK